MPIFNNVGKSQASELDFNINTCRELEAHHCVNDLLRRLDDVNESLVSSHLKLLAAVLVLVDCSKNGYDLTISRKRNGTRYRSAVAFSGLNDLLRSRVDKGVIVALESDSAFP